MPALEVDTRLEGCWFDNFPHQRIQPQRLLSLHLGRSEDVIRVAGVGRFGSPQLKLTEKGIVEWNGSIWRTPGVGVRSFINQYPPTFVHQGHMCLASLVTGSHWFLLLDRRLNFAAAQAARAHRTIRIGALALRTQPRLPHSHPPFTGAFIRSNSDH